jgi:hypothetical protein
MPLSEFAAALALLPRSSRRQADTRDHCVLIMARTTSVSDVSDVSGFPLLSKSLQRFRPPADGEVPFPILSYLYPCFH